MYEIELKNVVDGLPSLLDQVSQDEEIVLTNAHRPIAKITKLATPATESPLERGARAASLLEELARRKTFAGIADPVEWQREVREDRILPGRD